MIEVCILYEIARLFFITDWSFREIADYLNISHQSVSRFVTKLEFYSVTWPQIKDLNNLQFEELLAKRQEELKPENHESSLPSGKVHPNYKELAKEQLKNHGRKGTPTIRLRAKEHIKQFGEKAVGESTIYNGVRKAMVGLKHTLTQVFTPGRNLHIDYAGKQLYIGPNKDICLSFIIGVLAYSKVLFIKATFTQKQSDWLGFMQEVFVSLDGKTLFLITDNAPPLVKKVKPNLELTDGYRNFCRQWNVIADPVPPRSPNYNQPAEQGVKIFTEEIFPVLEACDFNTCEEVQAKTNEICNKINARLLSGSSKSRNDRFFGKEKSALQSFTNPLVTFPIMNRRFTVDKRYRYQFEGVCYSVPYDLFGKKLDVEIYESRLVFKLKGQVIWVHERKQECEGHAILLAHMPPNHRNLMKQDRFYFANWAKEIDPTLIEWIDAQYQGLPDFDYYGRDNCRKFQRLFDQYNDKNMAGEFVMTVDLCLRVNRPNLKSLNSFLHNDIANDDDALDVIGAYLASQESPKGGDNYVH